MTLRQQTKLAEKLMQWHGGMHSGVYAVASVMWSYCERGDEYNPERERGHLEIALPKAIQELRNLKKDANFPEAVTAKDEQECNNLAAKLESILTKYNNLVRN